MDSTSGLPAPPPGRVLRAHSLPTRCRCQGPAAQVKIRYFHDIVGGGGQIMGWLSGPEAGHHGRPGWKHGALTSRSLGPSVPGPGPAPKPPPPPWPWLLQGSLDLHLARGPQGTARPLLAPGGIPGGPRLPDGEEAAWPLTSGWLSPHGQEQEAAWGRAASPGHSRGGPPPRQ